MPELDPLRIEVLYELQKLRQQQSELTSLVQGVTSQVSKEARKQQQANKLVELSFDQLKPAIKGVEDRMAALNQDFKAGSITAGTYRNQMDSLEKELRQYETTANRATGRQRGFQSVVQNFIGLGIGTKFLQIGRDMIQGAGDAEETANRFQNVFKQQTEDAQEYVDGIVSTLGRSESELQDALASYQAIFKGLGLEGEDAAEFSKLLTDLSIDFGSAENFSLGESTEKFISALSGSSEVVAKYGIDLKEARVQQELAALATENLLTGNEQLDKTIARARIIEKTLETNDAIGDAVKTQATFVGSLQKIQGSLDNLSDAAGERIKNFLAPILNIFGNLLVGINNIIKQSGPLGNVLQGLLTAFLAAGAAVGVFAVAYNGLVLSGGLTFFKSVGTTISNLIPSIGGATKALNALKVAALANPFTALLVGLAAITTALAPVIVKTDEFKSVMLILRGAFQQIGQVASTIFAAIGRALVPVVDLFRGLASIIGDRVVVAWRLVFGLISTGLSSIGDIVRAVSAVFRGDFSGALEFVRNAFVNWGNAVFGFVRSVFNGIGQLLGVLGQAFEAWFGFVFRLTVAFWTDLFALAKNYFQNLGANLGALGKLFGATFSNIGKVAIAFFADLLSIGSNALRSLGNNLSIAATNAVNYFRNINWGEAWSGLTESAGQAIKNTLSAAGRAAKRIFTSIRDALLGRDTSVGDVGVQNVGNTGAGAAIEKLDEELADVAFSRTQAAVEGLRNEVADAFNDIELIPIEGGAFANVRAEAGAFASEVGGLFDSISISAEEANESVEKLAETTNEAGDTPGGNTPGGDTPGTGGGGGGGNAAKEAEEEQEEITAITLEYAKRRIEELNKLEKEALEEGLADEVEEIRKQFGELEDDIVSVFGATSDEAREAYGDLENFENFPDIQKAIEDEQKAINDALKETAEEAVETYKDYEKAVEDAEKSLEALEEKQREFYREQAQAARELAGEIDTSGTERLQELAAQRVDIEKQQKEAQEELNKARADGDQDKIESSKEALEEIEKEQKAIEAAIEATKNLQRNLLGESEDGTDLDKILRDAAEFAKKSQTEQDQIRFEEQQRLLDQEKDIRDANTQEELEQLKEGLKDARLLTLIEEKEEKLQALEEERIKTEELMEFRLQKALEVEALLFDQRLSDLVALGELDQELAEQIRAARQVVGGELGTSDTVSGAGVEDNNTTAAGGSELEQRVTAQLQQQKDLMEQIVALQEQKRQIVAESRLYPAEEVDALNDQEDRLSLQLSQLQKRNDLADGITGNIVGDEAQLEAAKEVFKLENATLEEREEYLRERREADAEALSSLDGQLATTQRIRNLWKEIARLRAIGGSGSFGGVDVRHDGGRVGGVRGTERTVIANAGEPFIGLRQDRKYAGVADSLINETFNPLDFLHYAPRGIMAKNNPLAQMPVNPASIGTVDRRVSKDYRRVNNGDIHFHQSRRKDFDWFVNKVTR